ncbi:hypothetical protein RND71_000640 [Anisodus tanguticus]|uniref:Pectin acetylesterase n=1 Tax=Anisodus tanguticus TaxID=243964 RepID=A0AAE1SWC6_9SOLA|nr:hypothetical protein RND71_000640 [Anisodus tanguticus]
MAKLFICFLGVIFVVSKIAVDCYEFEDFFYNKTEGAFLESVYGASAAGAPTPLMVGLTIIHGAAARGAVCLDGTLPGYHIHRGYGSGAYSWLVQLEGAFVVEIDVGDKLYLMLTFVVRREAFEEKVPGFAIAVIIALDPKLGVFLWQGGGWCNSVRSCVYRKKTRRGSSNYMEKQIPFTGILSNKAEENPDFYNWNRVKVRYCDGASFTGDSEDKAAGLQFRGKRIYQAAMDELMAKGMRYAKQALLSGCSAGGLASIMHCDDFSNLLPHTKVKCLSDAGLFMDVIDVSGGRSIRNFFGGVVKLQGLQKTLPRTCTNHLDATSCFFPQNLIGNIRTPLFLLNAAYDSWQLQESLAPHTADPHGLWHDCTLNNERCSPSQIRFLQGFRIHMLNSIKRFAASRKNGLFINSCFAHCQSERQDTWFSDNSPMINNKPIALAVGDWYFDRSGVKAIDCAYPCDRTCHNLVFKTFEWEELSPNLNGLDTKQKERKNRSTSELDDPGLGYWPNTKT